MNVYFYWSGQAFDFGHLLAIASAALHAPGDVVVLTDEQPLQSERFRQLFELPNVRVEPLDLATIMSADHIALYHRMRFVAHKSDLVRFAALAKWGGLYLDTDTVTLRPLRPSMNGRLLLDDGKVVYVGMMTLPAGDPLLLRMLDELVSMPEADLDVYQSIVYRWTTVVREAPEPIRFGQLAEFAPVHWRDWERIFIPGGFDGDVDRIRVLHHYGYFSRQYTASMDVGWLHANPCLFSRVALPVVDDLRTRLGVHLK